jgi:polar amino acid transport system substrate-binding protein
MKGSGWHRVLVKGLVVATLLCLQAENSLAQQRQSIIDKIQKEGVMRVCVAIATPWMMKDPKSGEFIGFDVDTIKELASILQVKPELVAVPGFGQLIASLQAGKCDVIMTALTRTVQRAVAVAFSEPYFMLGSVWVVRKDRRDLNTLQDLNKPTITVAVETGALSEQRTRKNLPNAKIKSLPGGGDALRMTEVESGRSDAAATDSIKVPMYAEQFGWAKFIPPDAFENPVDRAGIAYAVRREDLDFVNLLNVFIEQMRSTGKTDQLIKKWVNPEYIRLQ